MPVFELSRRAEADLEGIAEYTRDRWGLAQCGRYLDQLEACLERLAESPGQGRPCPDLGLEYFRFEHGRHVVFYRRLEGGIRVVRILHERMLPARHVSDDDADEP